MKIFYPMTLNECRIGIVFIPSAGVEFYLGWNGFSILWNHSLFFKDALGSLPEFPALQWPCKNCGSEDEGQSCNMEQRSIVLNCSKCSEVKIG